MRLIFSFGVISFLCCLSWAAGGGFDGSIPWDLIIAQTFNFTAFIVFLIWLLRTRVQNFFASYRQNFIHESSQAQNFIAVVEKKKKEIQNRLENLETTYSLKMETAKKEAQALKVTLVEEAQQKAQKMISEASEGTLLMFKNAERMFLKKSLDQAMGLAQKDLSKKVDDHEAQRLHFEFLKEIQRETNTPL